MAESVYPAEPILIVDDEENILESMVVTLSIAGFRNLITCNDSREVEHILARQPVSVLTLDLYMPHIAGVDLFPKIREMQPGLPVVVITGADEVELAVRCMKEGAFDYLIKPVNKTRLVTTIRHALEAREIRNENLLLKQSLLSEEIKHPEAFEAIVTQCQSMKSIYRYIEAIAETSLPILITGETGTGKELLARAAHKVSSRTGKFVAVNVAGLDDTLFSDTLFGHKKGAFTGAVGDREGMVGKAAQGTLFLDEIGDLGNESQIKLLRLLQEREYYPLGSDTAVPTDARFIFATNHDLESASKKDTFRKDLFYRLWSHHVHIPPLRERKEDLPLLISHFLEKGAEEIGRKKPKEPKELYTLLGLYDFPGNIRELEGMLYDAVVRHDSGILSLQYFRNILEDHKTPEVFERGREMEQNKEGGNMFERLENLPTLKAAGEMLIEEALKRADGNQTIAAQILGMTRTALNKRLNRIS